MQALKNNKDIRNAAPAVVDLLSKSREWLFETKSTKASKLIPLFWKTTPQTFTCSKHFRYERTNLSSREECSEFADISF